MISKFSLTKKNNIFVARICDFVKEHFPVGEQNNKLRSYLLNLNKILPMRTKIIFSYLTHATYENVLQYISNNMPEHDFK